MLFSWVFVSEGNFYISARRINIFIVASVTLHRRGKTYGFLPFTFNSASISVKKPQTAGDECVHLRVKLLWSQTEPKYARGFKRTSTWQGLTEIKEGWLTTWKIQELKLKPWQSKTVKVHKTHLPTFETEVNCKLIGLQKNLSTSKLFHWQL